MLSEINRERTNAGLATLAWDAKIHYIALDWSDHIAGTQRLAHNPDYGTQIARERNYNLAGENVGRAPSPEAMFRAFMASEGHRRNILRVEFRHLTVGCLTDSTGQYWATQNFWG